MSSTQAPEKLKVTELKAILKERGLDTTGRKADLVARLEEALASETLGTDENIDGTADDANIDGSVDGTIEAEDTTEAVAETTEAVAPEVETVESTETAAPAAVTTDTGAALDELLAAKKRRAERFGVEVNISKAEKNKLKREQQKAKRQAKQAELKAAKAELEAKKKARAERFGDFLTAVKPVGQKNKKSTSSTQPTKKRKTNKGEQVITARTVTKEEYAKMEARAKKFGTTMPASITIAGEEDAKKLERFATSTAEAEAEAVAEVAAEVEAVAA